MYIYPPLGKSHGILPLYARRLFPFSKQVLKYSTTCGLADWFYSKRRLQKHYNPNQFHRRFSPLSFLLKDPWRTNSNYSLTCFELRSGGGLGRG